MNGLLLLACFTRWREFRMIQQSISRSVSYLNPIVNVPIVSSWHVRHLAGLLMVVLATGAVAEEPNWAQWRGPNGTGKTSSVATVTDWDASTNLKWRSPLPEAGNSTPVIWGDKMFITQPFAETKERGILCLERSSGKELWRRGVVYTESEPTHKTNPFCSASPVTDGKRVIAWLGSAGLICWDVDGTELWRRELGRQRHMWGYGSSPILHQDLCIVNFGPGEREFLIAVDKTTGQTVWQVDALQDAEERELSGPENDGNANEYQSEKERSVRLRGSWNTPIIARVGNRDELIVALPRRLAAFDPLTGKSLWNCGGGAPLAYASVVEHRGVIVVLGGYNGASMAVRAGGSGDVTETHRLWHKPRDNGWLGTGVADNGAVYVCDMGGVLHCISVESGDIYWKSRVEGGGTWSSITQTADGMMHLLTKTGATTVFKPNQDKFDEVAVNELEEATNASVVIAGGEVYVRTDLALWCFAKRPL